MTIISLTLTLSACLSSYTVTLSGVAMTMTAGTPPHAVHGQVRLQVVDFAGLSLREQVRPAQCSARPGACGFWRLRSLRS